MFQPSFRVLAVLCVLASAACQAADDFDLDLYLSQGRLREADAELQSQLETAPDDDQLSFSLGVVRLLVAAERFAQGQYRYGFLYAVPPQMRRFPVNPQPERFTYDRSRELLQQLHDDLKAAEEVFSRVEGEFGLVVHVGRVRLDLDGDGKATNSELLWRNIPGPLANIPDELAAGFKIRFDGADAAWSQGYCNLLMAWIEFALAHDWRTLFERSAHLFYPKAETPYEFLQPRQVDLPSLTRNPDIILDFIAMVHSLNFPLREAERMERSRQHLLEVVRLSRVSWDRITQETDDEFEWLPNSQQTGVIPNLKISGEMIEAWRNSLNEFESLLEGRKLLPFWRRSVAELEDGQRLGVNLHRVFTEPRDFDLVLWITGVGAAPYLERGEISGANVWGEIARTFGGANRLIGFGFWFN